MSHPIHSLLTACLLFASLPASYAQDEAKLSIPSSPAFSILNFEPSAILRPTNNRALATDVLNAFDKDGKLLTNLAMEVSPYWLKSHSALTRETYKETKNFLQVFLQTFSLSAASVKDSANGDHKLGIGFRCKVINGKSVDEIRIPEAVLNRHQNINNYLEGNKDQFIAKKRTKVEEAILDIETILITSLSLTEEERTNFHSYAQIKGKGFKNNETDVKQFIIALCKDYMDDQKKTVEKVAVLNEKRKGFILEFAGASGFNNTHGNSLERAGFWINGSTYVSGSDLLTITARYMFQNKDSALSNFDIGLGYVKQAGNFNVSVEALIRFWNQKAPVVTKGGDLVNAVENTVNYRLAAQASYAISKNISVNLSIGKSFDAPDVSSSAFFSILGFNYSLFRNLN